MFGLVWFGLDWQKNLNFNARKCRLDDTLVIKKQEPRVNEAILS